MKRELKGKGGLNSLETDSHQSWTLEGWDNQVFWPPAILFYQLRVPISQNVACPKCSQHATSQQSMPTLPELVKMREGVEGNRIQIAHRDREGEEAQPMYLGHRSPVPLCS